MSFRPFAVLLSLLAYAVVAPAQDARPKSRFLTEADTAQLEQAKRQKRRDELREALLMPAAPAESRQLSPQEKAELRQQLRQQRSDPPRKDK
jgi:hypothetical protein